MVRGFACLKKKVNFFATNFDKHRNYVAVLNMYIYSNSALCMIMLTPRFIQLIDTGSVNMQLCINGANLSGYIIIVSMVERP